MPIRNVRVVDTKSSLEADPLQVHVCEPLTNGALEVLVLGGGPLGVVKQGDARGEDKAATNIKTGY